MDNSGESVVVLWWAGCWFVSWLVVTNIQVTNNKLLLLAWQ
jgi:hypothetical protein